MTRRVISWGGVYYAASAHPKQYFCSVVFKTLDNTWGRADPQTRLFAMSYCNAAVKLRVNTEIQKYKYKCKKDLSIVLQGEDMRRRGSKINLYAGQQTSAADSADFPPFAKESQVLIFVLISDRETPILR